MTNPVVPPSNLDAEQSVLGAVLLSDTALTIIDEEGLTPEHFYQESYGVVFQGMLDMEATGAPVDAVTLCDWLKSTGVLERVGGAGQIELLAGSVPGVGNLRRYVQIVKRKAVDRWRLSAAYEQIAAIQEEDDEGWSRAIAAADSAALVGKHDTLIDPMSDFETWYAGTQGWPTPYPKLTKAIGGGLVPGDITVVGAWPGFGKTIVVDTFVLHACEEAGANCHIYLNELNSGIRTARMLARMTNVDWQRIRDRELSPEEYEAVMACRDRFPAKYERTNGWKVDDYVRHLRRKRWDIAVIDSASRIPNRDTHDLEQVVGALADVAAEVGTHLILVVQLNLERSKGLERPMPSGRDLLGGGAWHRDSRNVIFVHRSQEIETVLGQEKAVPQEDGMIYADKATHGEPEKSMVMVRFNPERMKFDPDTPTAAPVSKQPAYFDEFDDPGPAQKKVDWGF